MPLRFRDAGRSSIYHFHFRDHYLVRCPRCDGRARLLNHDAAARGPRLACTGRGYAKDWAGGHSFAHRRGGELRIYRTRPRSGGAERYDPFDLELWLKAPCRGETLWTYNEEHLAFLRHYVAARLRERAPKRNGSLASRLPT